MKRTRPPQYRHELKYFINQGEYTLLSGRLQKTMAADAYAKKNGGEYFIRSLYFDDPMDSAFREKMRGNDVRDKIRLRTYNLQQDEAKLERKYKKDSFIYKQSLRLSRGECDQLLAGRYGFLLRRPEDFAHVMFREFTTRALRPAVIVDYVREPFVFPFQNVRVTFDKELHTGYQGMDLFDPDLPTYPLLEGYDMVLEVKFNQYLPGYIRELIQCDAHVRSAIAFAGNSTCKGPGFVFSRFSEKKRLGGMGACFLCPVTI